MSEIETSIQQESINRLDSIIKALEWKRIFPFQTQIPNVRNYSPQNLLEFETQQFNLYLQLPNRIQSEDELSMWILENQQLNREQVGNFLKQPNSQLSQNILYRIASKICQLEIGKSFIEGLKLFLPTCGVWDLFIEDALTTEDSVAKFALETYIQAHINFSPEPLFELNLNHMPVLVQIALAIIKVFDSIQNGSKPQASIMATFTTDLKSATNTTIDISLSNKAISELFILASSPISNLKISTDSPSYLFSTFVLETNVTIQFKAFPHTTEETKEVHLKLTKDTLFIFNMVNNSISSMYSCVPLGSLQCETSEYAFDRIFRLTLLSQSFIPFPSILFKEMEYPYSNDISYVLSLPNEIIFLESFNIQLNSLNEFECWFDKLSAAIWNSTSPHSHEQVLL